MRRLIPFVLPVMLCVLMLCGCTDHGDVLPDTICTTAPTETTVPTESALPDVTTVPTTVPTEPTDPAPTTVPTVPTDPVPTTAPVETTEPEQTTPPTVPPQTTAPASTEPPPTTVPVSVPEPADGEFVKVRDYLPDVVIDLKYATTDNICGKVVYSFKDAYLRYGTVKKLEAVQSELKSMGYRLKIWDAYRPATAQREIWQACHDTTYVTNPQRGYSAHCLGSHVDVTIVDQNGKELVMPSGFDQYDASADRDYSDCSAEAAKNAQLLESVMTKHGFKGHLLEWWQYTDTVDYGIELEFLCD